MGIEKIFMTMPHSPARFATMPGWTGSLKAGLAGACV
jgi:hypothetical protein